MDAQRDDADEIAPWAARARRLASLVSGAMFAAVFLIFNYKTSPAISNTTKLPGPMKCR